MRSKREIGIDYNSMIEYIETFPEDKELIKEMNEDLDKRLFTQEEFFLALKPFQDKIDNLKEEIKHLKTLNKRLQKRQIR